MSKPVFESLAASGLNLHAVFEVSQLPADVLATLPTTTHRQLILIGHVGPSFWRALERAGMAGPDPVDAFSRSVAHRWLAGLTDVEHITWLYPGDTPVGLQRLGALAGWHHDSPFKVGIHPRWGTWFAYRVAVLADTELPPSPTMASAPGPCKNCADRPCIPACPAKAMPRGRFDLAACLAYRTAPGSACADTCLARLACPVGSEFRYPTAQIGHAYRHSLTMIRRVQAGEPGS